MRVSLLFALIMLGGITPVTAPRPMENNKSYQSFTIAAILNEQRPSGASIHIGSESVEYLEILNLNVCTLPAGNMNGLSDFVDATCATVCVLSGTKWVIHHY